LRLAQGIDCVGGRILSGSGGKPENSIYEIAVRQDDVVDQILEEEVHWRPDLMMLATQGPRESRHGARRTTERVLRMRAALFSPIPSDVTDH
jgi:hypothetical protein